MATSAVTGEAFERVVLDSEQPVIVDFCAPRCGPSLACTLVTRSALLGEPNAPDRVGPSA